MASLYEDPSTPAAVKTNSSAGSAYSGTFSPPAGTWVYVFVSWMFASNTTGVTLTCYDTNGNNYGSAVKAVQDVPGATANAAFRFYYSSAPGAIQAQVLCTSFNQASALIAPRVLVGAAVTQTSAGGTTATATSATWTHAAPTTVAGSLVYTVAGCPNAINLTAVANTVTVTGWSNAIVGDTGIIGVSANTTGTPGSITLGWNASASESFGFLSLEVLPATAGGGGSMSGGMTLPTLTTVPAGYVVQAADLNNMAYACSFLMAKPLTRIHTATAGQSLPSGTATLVNFDTVDFDLDGMWQASTPGQLTIQTPGFYKVRYGIVNASVTGNGWIQVTTGTNNPAGSGITADYYYCYNFGSSAGTGCGGAGVIGQRLYTGDIIQVYFKPFSATTVGNSPIGPYLSLEYVSI